MLVFAIVYWATGIAADMLGPRLGDGRLLGLVQGIGFALPLVLAFAIGGFLRSWWCLIASPLTIVLLQLPFPLYGFLSLPRSNRRQAATGLFLAIAEVAISALLAMLAAGAGVLLGILRTSG